MTGSFLRKIVSIVKVTGLHRLGFFRGIADRLRKIRIPFPVSIQGFSLKPIKLSIYLAGAHEPGTTALCRKIIQKGWTVLDLGAGDGYFTVLFSRLVGPEGKVFAFEPDDINIKNLRSNVARNGCANVVIIPKAVAERTGKMRFFSADTKGTGSLFYESPGRGRWIEVDTVSLEDYFRDYQGQINFFKMDIEGGEAAALKGMQDILSRAREGGHRISGVVELSPHLLDSINISSEDFLDKLTDYGFNLYGINDDGSVEKLSNSSLVALARRSKHINIFID